MLDSASAKDLIAIMTDHYKSQNLEKLRQKTSNSLTVVTKQVSEDFVCNERIREVKIPRNQNGGINLGGGSGPSLSRPGFSSSSEDEDMLLPEENGAQEGISNKAPLMRPIHSYGGEALKN